MVIQGVTYLSDFEAKKAIIEAARRMEAKGFLVAGDGSLSVRVGPSAVWVTISGADKAALTQDMLVRVDLNGKQMLSARAKPLPEDLPIHLKIYQENDSVQCVLHAYPPCAAIMGLQGQSVQPAAFSPAVRTLGRVQLLPGQAAEPQAQAVSLLCRTDKGVLLQNDGCMTWGRTPTEACHLVEALDYYAVVTARLGSAPMSAPAVPAAPALQPAPVEASPVSTFEDRIIFIVDYILERMQENKQMLRFISKNLSWGIFRQAILSSDDETEISIMELYRTRLLENPTVRLRAPETMMFLIIELASSTSYSTILENDPISFEELKPYLNESIRAIIQNHEIK